MSECSPKGSTKLNEEKKEKCIIEYSLVLCVFVIETFPLENEIFIARSP